MMGLLSEANCCALCHDGWEQPRAVEMVTPTGRIDAAPCCSQARIVTEWEGEGRKALGHEVVPGYVRQGADGALEAVGPPKEG